MSSVKGRWLVFFGICFSYCGCSTTPPVDDYSLARTAISAAKDVDSARYAPSYWHRAEDAYRKGEAHYKDQDYEEAQAEFIQAREYAERAENVTRVQKYKSGEVEP